MSAAPVDQRRFLLWVLTIESALVASSALLIEMDAPLGSKLSTLAISLVAGTILTVLFVGVPLWISSYPAPGLLGNIAVGAGVAMLTIALWTAFVAPAIWQAWGECLPPGGEFDGRCEVGPL